MRPTLKTTTLFASLGLIGLTAALTACGGKEQAGVAAAVAPVSASLAKAEAREIPRRIELYGTVEADQTSAVGSRVMASVVSVPVKAGDLVKAGQLLVEIDPQTARGQESQARGALAQARAALSLAERNFERFKNLKGSGAASELELDMARMQYEQAKGAVEQAQGAVEAASSVAKESRVVAPFAGRVAQKLVEAGDLAAPGRPLVMLESAQGRRLSVSVPESVMASSTLAVGQVLPIRIDSLPRLTELKGRIAEISSGADPASHTFTMKVEVTGSVVPSGFTGRALLDAGRRKAVLVPAGAVLTQGGVSMVVVRDEEGKARSRAVTVGEVEGGFTEVLSGLSGGETVLVGLAGAPRDGAAVTAEVRK